MPGTLDTLPADALPALSAHVARLKHDLGKYVALRQRWLAEGASAQERREALVDDLLATRRGPDATLDAVSVWSEFRPALMGEDPLPGGHRVDLSQDRDVRALEEAMTVLARVTAALRAGESSDDLVQQGSTAALAVSDGCRSLDRRVKARGR